MKNPISRSTIAFALALVAAPAVAQNGHSLIFSAHNGSGHDHTISISTATLLGELSRHDLAVIRPSPGASAETFLTHANFDVMHGDKNCDGVPDSEFGEVQPAFGAGPTWLGRLVVGGDNEDQQ